MKNKIPLLFLIITCITTNGQNNIKHFATTPEASSLMKFVDFPSSNYQGIPDIAIPLFQFKYRDIPIDISLNYTSCGIKVDEDATSAGLGWDVNLGGSVVRVVRGQVDQGIFNYKNINGIVDEATGGDLDNPKTFMASMFFGGIFSGMYNEPGGLALYPEPPFNVLNNGARLDDNIDYEPDYFYFKFLNYSGKFIASQDGKYKTFDGNKFKIDELPDNKGWIITSPDGYKGEFTMQGTMFGVNSIITEHYMLTKVVSPLGCEIKYEYSRWGFYTKKYSQTFEKITGTPISENKLNATLNFAINSSAVSGSSCHLDRICFPSGEKIVVKYKNRDDLDGCPAIHTIQLIKNEKIISGYLFEHSYFKTKKINKYDKLDEDTITTKYSIRRLKLDKIYQLGTEKDKKTPYVFKYNDIQLPSKYSYSIDHWGYFNNASNSSLLKIPSEVFGGHNADRSVNPNYSQACMLERITYPTGGATHYIYEQNYRDNNNYGPGLRIKCIEKYDSNGSMLVNNNFKYYDPILPSLLPLTLRYSKRLFSSFGGVKYYLDTECHYSGVIVPLSTSASDIKVGYGKVTESSYEGSIETFYENISLSYEFRGSLLPNTPSAANPGNGRILEKIFLNLKNDTVRRETYQYSDNLEIAWGSQVEKELGGCDLNLTIFHCYPTSLLNSKLTSVHIIDGAITRNNEYYYDNSVHAQMTRTKYDNREDTYVYTLYSYDYASTGTGDFIGEMKNAHILNKPIEKIFCIKDKTSGNLYVTGGELYTYKTGTHVGQIESIYKLKTQTPILMSLFKFSNRRAVGEMPHINTNFSTFSITNIDAHYTTNAVETIMLYDSNNNPQEFRHEDNTSSTYLWSYHHQYPIAEIKNATYDEVKAALNYTDAQMEALSASDNPDITYIRTQFKNNFAGNLVLYTTYTYKPLVGMTSATDPRGVTTYYEYDKFNRLKQTYIIEGGVKKILQENKYNYANQ